MISQQREVTDGYVIKGISEWNVLSFNPLLAQTFGCVVRLYKFNLKQHYQDNLDNVGTDMT